MTKTSAQNTLSVLRIYLLPYAFLLILYLVVIGGGSTWLYLSARHAQTELVTAHIIDIVTPVISQLSNDYQSSVETNSSIKLRDKVAYLYKTLPHLREVSLRDHRKGFGVRLTSAKQLVDVELEPLTTGSMLPKSNQKLAHRLHQEETPLFHIHFNLTSPGNQPALLELAFDRLGLVGQIGSLLQSLINSIVLFSVLGIISMLIALGVSIYTGTVAQKMGASLQTIYQQASMWELAVGLVHDLRNPLASIRANIKNLLITPNETQEVIDEIDQDLVRLDSKLSGFLQLTKPRTSHFEPVNIEAFAEELIRACKPLFKDKNLSLSVDIASNIPLVIIREADLRDAILNLLVNAINHSPEQGRLIFKIHHTHSDLEIVVEDDGPGISESVLPHIFEPFFTTRSSGHGLGLAIVRRTIEAHDGIIKAENRAPTGARFIITLPLKSHKA